ncbi:MAG: hypothetical protein HY673_12360 [Chloroflexi bacterium]|nr:hypothetical protein [Chloroflexota bacterium]
MKLTRELGDQRPHAFVFTGDGQAEIRHLEAISNKFDGEERQLLFPIALAPQKTTGLNALAILRVAIPKYPNLRRFLFIVDREHFSSSTRRVRKEAEVAAFLTKQLHASVFKSTELTPDVAFLINGSLEANAFELCIAIRGFTAKGGAEEEMARLIELKLHAQVEPNHEAVRKFLKDRRTDESRLIKHSSIKYVEQAFPGICSALRWLEKQP